MPYQAEITRRARRSLQRIPGHHARRVLLAVQGLENDPFPTGAAKLVGAAPPLWRIRVGDYRIVYSVSSQEQIVIIEEIARRDSQTYERLP